MSETIHTDDRLIFAQKPLALAGQVLHLLIPVFILFLAQTFPILLQGVPQLFGEARNGAVGNAVLLSLQFLRQPTIDRVMVQGK